MLFMQSPDRTDGRTDGRQLGSEADIINAPNCEGYALLDTTTTTAAKNRFIFQNILLLNLISDSSYLIRYCFQKRTFGQAAAIEVSELHSTKTLEQ